VTGVLFSLAILAAVFATGMRRLRRHRLRRAAAERPGVSPERAIAIQSYAEIDDHLARRWCICGGYLERAGEGTRVSDGRRFRILTVVDDFTRALSLGGADIAELLVARADAESRCAASLCEKQ